MRALKHAEHAVFCVDDGQKTYYDPQFDRIVPYSSGQQVKRSVLQYVSEQLDEPVAPITFNYEIDKNKKLGTKEPWSPCDPTYIDQLLGGWMRAKTATLKSKGAGEDAKDDTAVLKRRSPLSISAMRPLHPLLAGIDKENLTFDRSDRPDIHPVRVRRADTGKELSEDEIEAYLVENGRTLGRRTWIPDNKRATGLFVYDVAVDLRTLFSVSLNQQEPEVTPEIITKLKEAQWIETKNTFGRCLVMPRERRETIIPALAEALINWRITSNQARTFALLDTLSVAVSDNASQIASAIRAKLIDDGGKQRAKPLLDAKAGADLYVALPCAGYIVTECESPDALVQAKADLVKRMLEFDYENQI